MEEEKKEEETRALSETKFLILVLGLILVLILDFLLPIETPIKSLAQGYYHQTIKLAQEKEATRAKHIIIKLEGKASWYGPKFHGRQMANGEIFNKEEFILASNLPLSTLPLNKKVKVTNPQNNESEIARAKDRGPWAFVKTPKGNFKPLKDKNGKLIPHQERSFDLSEALARKLGLKEQGVGEIVVEFLVTADS